MLHLHIFHFTKDLESQEVPGWARDFWPEVIGFVHGFSFDSCFPKFEHPGFFLVPILYVAIEETHFCLFPTGRLYYIVLTITLVTEFY